MLLRVALPALLFAAAADAQRPITPADLLAFQTVGDIQPSPDGRTILFTVESQVMRMPATGGDLQPMAGVPKGASSIRWSPDGKRLAYFHENALWSFDIAAGKATRLSDAYRSNAFLSKAGNMLAWSPNGEEIAFAATLEPPPAPQDPVVVTRILYKGRTALSDNRRTHVYAIPAAGGKARPLTSGNADAHSIAWTPNSRSVVYLSSPETDPDARLNYDIFVVDAAYGKRRQITATPGVEMDPQVSPDGQWIAYTATTRAITTIDSVAEDAHAWVVPFDSGAAREVNGALDRRTSGVAWMPGGKRLVYTVSDHGSTLICTSAIDGASKPSCDTGRGAQAGSVAVASDGALYFSMSTPQAAGELHRLDPGAREPRPLTKLNRALTTQLQLSAPETITFKSFDGTEVEGWLYPARNARGPAPLILAIHGGPHGAFGYGFNPTFHLYAARGYATLAINPRGSSGYGQKFSDGTLNNWGGGDYQDLMAGLDHVLATHANIDRNRLFVTGASYGGYMTNWVITQTNRFKAAVASASVSNLISFYATSLYQDLVHAEFNGFPWAGDNFATLWKWSPLAHVGKATTPTLFLHGENDNDVHITQAEEMFTALRQRGIVAELVRYPREGHGFREPKHRQDAVERTLAWFDRFR